MSFGEIHNISQDLLLVSLTKVKYKRFAVIFERVEKSAQCCHWQEASM